MKQPKEPINTKSLLVSILFLMVGIVFCFNSDFIFEVIGYVISGILILSGIVKLAIYSGNKRKQKALFSDFALAIFLLSLGAIIAIFPKSIPVTISIVVGCLVLFNGINRLILGLAIRKIDDRGSKVFLLVAALIILLGIIIITQAFLPLLGVFIIVYSISEIFGYVYYKSQNKDYSEVLINRSIPQDVKEKEAIEAEIVEE